MVGWRTWCVLCVVSTRTTRRGGGPTLPTAKMLALFFSQNVKMCATASVGTKVPTNLFLDVVMLQGKFES